MYIITWDLHLVTLSQITYWYSYLLLLKKGLAKYTQLSTYLSVYLPPRDRQVGRQGDQNDPGVNASWLRDQSSFDLAGRRTLHSRSAQLLQDSTPPPTRENTPTNQKTLPPQEHYINLSPHTPLIRSFTRWTIYLSTELLTMYTKVWYSTCLDRFYNPMSASQIKQTNISVVRRARLSLRSSQPLLRLNNKRTHIHA